MHQHPGNSPNSSPLQQPSGVDGHEDGAAPREQERLTAAVSEFVEHRSAIEQTKGMLMLIYDLNEAAAFKLLQWRSQEANVKLRVLAEQIAADIRGLGRSEPLSAYNNVLLTAHERIDTTPNPASDGNETDP